MIRLILILIFLASCQSQKAKNTRSVLAKELNEYSYVVNSWFFENGKIIGFSDENNFINDYLNAASKEQPPKYLVYYFEDKEMDYAYKLKLTLDKTTQPRTTFEKLKSDKLGCSSEQFANEDFRRQSCYYNEVKPIIGNGRFELKLIYQRVLNVIKQEGLKTDAALSN